MVDSIFQNARINDDYRNCIYDITLYSTFISQALVQKRAKQMTTKNCGNCESWNTNHVHIRTYIRPCMNKNNIAGWLKPMRHDEGQDCPVYKERQDAE